MQKPTPLWSVLTSVVTVFVCFSTVLVTEYFDSPAGLQQVAEGAFIENASAALWFLAAAVTLVIALRRRNGRWDLLLIGYAFLLCAFRELDFHTRFTSWNLGHAIKYTKDFVPLSERLTAFTLLVAPLLLVILLIATRWRRIFRRAWSEGRAWTRGVLWWIALLVAARIADKLSGRWTAWYAASDNAWLFRASEESLELGLALLTLLLVAPLVSGAGDPHRSTPLALASSAMRRDDCGAPRPAQP